MVKLCVDVSLLWLEHSKLQEYDDRHWGVYYTQYRCGVCTMFAFIPLLRWLS